MIDGERARELAEQWFEKARLHAQSWDYLADHAWPEGWPDDPTMQDQLDLLADAIFTANLNVTWNEDYE